jgi:O-acetyl-ADP-ribose deacetylase (regulator of RNase III)
MTLLSMSFESAMKNALESIAFPAVGSGILNFSTLVAAQVAARTPGILNPKP